MRLFRKKSQTFSMVTPPPSIKQVYTVSESPAPAELVNLSSELDVRAAALKPIIKEIYVSGEDREKIVRLIDAYSAALAETVAQLQASTPRTLGRSNVLARRTSLSWSNIHMNKLETEKSALQEEMQRKDERIKNLEQEVERLKTKVTGFNTIRRIPTDNNVLRKLNSGSKFV